MTSQSRRSVSLTLARHKDGGLEIFWGQRPLHRSFLPGFHSFFAGSVKPDDPNDQTAALRECFEECGLLLTKSGPQIISPPQRTPQLFRELSHQMSPPEMVDLGWWRTPTWLEPPFITHFFALTFTEDDGRQLDDLAHFLDPKEFLNGQWIQATKALERWQNGQVFLTTPLTLILKSLAQEIPAQADPPLPVPSFGTSADAPPTADAIEIAGGVHLLPLRTPTLPPATHTNAIIIGDQSFVVVDPGPTERAVLRPLLEHLNQRIAKGHTFAGIALTHHHPDHIGGLKLLTAHFDVPILAHPQTLNRLPDPPHHIYPLNDGDRLPTDSTKSFVALFTPGHAPGHLVFHQPDTGLILAGDLVASKGTIIIDPPDGHMGSYLQSLHRVHDLNPKALLPAHGHLILQPNKLLDHYIAHRIHREALIYQALRKIGRATAPDLVPLVYPEIPRSVWPLAERSLLAHLIHLVESGQASVQDDQYAPLNTAC